MKSRLSKSTFIRGLQYEKSLFLRSRIIWLSRKQFFRLKKHSSTFSHRSFHHSWFFDLTQYKGFLNDSNYLTFFRPIPQRILSFYAFWIWHVYRFVRLHNCWTPPQTRSTFVLLALLKLSLKITFWPSSSLRLGSATHKITVGVI